MRVILKQDYVEAARYKIFGNCNHVLASGKDVCRRLRTPLNKSNEVINEEKMAVACGYWHLWLFNPAEEEEGKNGFHLDSAEPDWSKFRDFIMGEVRYNSLMKTFPQQAEELFVATERNAKLRYEGYKKLSV